MKVKGIAKCSLTRISFYFQMERIEWQREEVKRVICEEKERERERQIERARQRLSKNQCEMIEVKEDAGS